MSKQTGKHYLDSVYNSVNPEDLAASQKKIEELNTQLNTLIRKVSCLYFECNFVFKLIEFKCFVFVLFFIIKRHKI